VKLKNILELIKERGSDLMRKQDVETIKQTISVIIGEPLRIIDRAGTFVRFNFGDLTEEEVPCCDDDGELVRDSDGRVKRKKIMSGRYALDPICSVRLTCDDKVILSDSLIQLPNSQMCNSPDFDWDNFDWNKPGNNSFDEVVTKHIGNEPFDFIVSKIDVNKFGDLTISFSNGFIIQLFADGTDKNENWRFYDLLADDKYASLVVLGDGIKKTDT